MYARLLGIGAIYGFGFTMVKGLFPIPVLLLLLTNEASTEGNTTVLATVYLLSGLIAGVVGGPLFGLLLLRRKGQGAEVGRISAVPTAGADLWRSLVLSLGLALLIGFISACITIAAYLFGLLPPGGVLDPIALIRSSNFSPGYPLLVGWTFARDLFPAALAGLLLAPFGGGFLYRLYAARRPQKDAPSSRSFEEFEDDDF